MVVGASLWWSHQHAHPHSSFLSFCLAQCYEQRGKREALPVSHLSLGTRHQHPRQQGTSPTGVLPTRMEPEVNNAQVAQPLPALGLQQKVNTLFLEVFAPKDGKAPTFNKEEDFSGNFTGRGKNGATQFNKHVLRAKPMNVCTDMAMCTHAMVTETGPYPQGAWCPLAEWMTQQATTNKA